MGDSSAVVDEKSFPGPGHAVQITPAAPFSSTKSALGPSLDNRTYIKAISPIYVNVSAPNVGASSDGSSSATSESSSEANGGRRKRPFVHLLLEITDGVGSIVEWDDLAFSHDLAFTHDLCGRLCSPDNSQRLWIGLPKRDRLTLLKYLKTTAHLSERAPW